MQVYFRCIMKVAFPNRVRWSPSEKRMLVVLLRRMFGKVVGQAREQINITAFDPRPIGIAALRHTMIIRKHRL
jgi:hypothetical protein